MVECYRRAAPLLDPPAERVEIPHLGTAMPAYLRLPAGQTRAPCLVMLGGADTVKEECHAWTEYFLERGVGTLTLDGPGQGETHARLPMSAEYEQAVSAARQWLQEHPAIDPDRIGLWGCSTGGYLAARSMALDPRFKLGVSVGGFYDARRFPYWGPTTQERFRRLFWLASVEEAAEYVRDHVTLSGYLAKLERPLLIVHGAADHLVPRDEIEQMAEEGGDRAELWVYEGGGHAVWNRLHIAAPRTADWVAASL
jgi:dipeptidyl aminopeptidase/acylaminoacyl peptidase